MRRRNQRKFNSAHRDDLHLNSYRDPKTSSDSLADLVMATETKSDIFYDSLVLPSGVFLCNKASDSAAIECVRTISKTESFQTVQTTETLHYTIPTDLQGALITDFENRSPLIPTLETKSEATRETGLFVTGVAVVGILGVIAFLWAVKRYLLMARAYAGSIIGCWAMWSFILYVSLSWAAVNLSCRAFNRF